MKGWVVIAGLLLGVAVLLIAVLQGLGDPTAPSPGEEASAPTPDPPAETEAPAPLDAIPPELEPDPPADRGVAAATPSPVRPGWIEGEVAFLGGGPCAGARVLFMRAGEKSITHTGEQGRFRSSGIAPGDYRVRVESTGFPPQEDRSVVVIEGQATTCTFSVPPGVRVEGNVVDVLTRRPINGARVTLLCDPEVVPSSKLETKDAVTDEQGRFRLERVYPDHALLGVEAEGYHSRRDRFIVRAEDHGVIQREVPLIGVHRVRGRVVDAKGRPVSGAEVACRYADLHRRWTHWRPPVTDAAGKFELVPDAVSGGKPRRVYAVREGFAPGHSREFTLLPGEVVGGLVIRLSRGGAVTGLVGGGGEQHVEVVLQPTWGPDIRFRTATERSGQYRIEHVRPGQYNAIARLGSRIDFKRYLVIKEGETLEDQNFSLEAGAKLRGEIVDGSNRPLPGLAVGLGNKYRFPPHDQMARTDENGRFGFAELRWDVVYRVSVEERWFRKAGVKVTARTGAVRLVLHRVFPVAGRVRMPEGEPAREFRITVYRLVGRDRPRAVFHGEQVFRDPEGRFEYADVENLWSYQVVAQSGHYRSPPVEGRVEDDKPSAPLALVLEAAATLEGAVLSPTGERLSGAVVEAERIPGPFKTSVRTGLNGRFRIEAVLPGIYRLRAAHAAWADVEERFHIGSPGPCRHDLVLKPGGVLLITVHDARRKPLPGARVRLEDSQGRPVVDPWLRIEVKRRLGRPSPSREDERPPSGDALVDVLRRSAKGLGRTDANGQCTLRALAAGSYRVSIQSGTRWLHRQVEIRTGLTTRLRVEAP